MIPEDFSTLSTRSEGAVLWVSLDNGPLNLMDEAMFEDLVELVEWLEHDASVRVVVLDSANPDYFCAHADVNAWTGGLPELPPASREPNPYQALFARLRRLPKATIALIEGRARGGGAELALALDMRFADRDRAVLGQPEVGLGAVPGFGSTQYIPLLAGRGRALEIILSADDYDGAQAEAYGLVNRALPGERLRPFVEDLARRIATFSADAIAAAKRAVDAGETELTAGLLIENDQLMATLGTAEVPRRMRRFLELGGQTPEFESDLGTKMTALAGS